MYGFVGGWQSAAVGGTVGEHVGMFHASMSASGQGATFYPSSCPPAPLTLSQTPVPRRRTCLLSLWCGIYGGGMVWCGVM